MPPGKLRPGKKCLLEKNASRKEWLLHIFRPEKKCLLIKIGNISKQNLYSQQIMVNLRTIKHSAINLELNVH